MPQTEVVEYFSKWFARSTVTIDLLRPGESGPHVQNIATVLLELGYRIPVTDTFNQDLSQELRRFQEDNKHPCIDGLFGPGTRKLLVEKALTTLGASFFAKLRPAFPGFHRVFISYAWRDTPKVDKLDQWLRDRGSLVTRDTRDFTAGHKLPDEILKYLHLSDKACIILSEASRSRDWPTFERDVAQKVEALRGIPLLIFILLDGTAPPKQDPTRIYIDASTRSLKEVGADLIRAITGQPGESPRVDYNEDELL